MAIAKAAVAIVGVVGVATATSLALVSSSPQPMPKWRELSQDTSATNTYASGKYANPYLKFFVGVDEPATPQTGHINNTKWWEWSYENNYSKKADDKSGFANKDNATALKDACKLAYQAESANIKKGNDKPTAATHFKEEDIWKYCSPAKEKITTIQDESDSYADTNTYGGSTTYKTSLVSVKEGKNAWFWNLKQEELIKATSLTDGTHVFKKLQDKLKGVNTGDSTVKSTLRETCKEAYGKNTSSDLTNYPKAEVGKFCSLSGTTLS